MTWDGCKRSCLAFIYDFFKHLLYLSTQSLSKIYLKKNTKTKFLIMRTRTLNMNQCEMFVSKRLLL